MRVQPRSGRASQGHIHAPSLDHATTAAVLRSGWSAFGTAEAGSPLAVDLSAPANPRRAVADRGRPRRAGARTRCSAPASSSGCTTVTSTRSSTTFAPPCSRAPGSAAAHRSGWSTACCSRARTPTASTGRRPSSAVRDRGRPARTPQPPVCARAVLDTVADLDAVADALFAQAVHALLRGTRPSPRRRSPPPARATQASLCSTSPRRSEGSSWSRYAVIGAFGAALAAGPGRAPAACSASPSRGSSASSGRCSATRDASLPTSAATTTPRARRPRRARARRTRRRLPGRRPRRARRRGRGRRRRRRPHRPPAGLETAQLGLADFVVVARAVRDLLGRIRALTAADLTDDPEAVGDGRDLADLRSRLDAATALLLPTTRGATGSPRTAPSTRRRRRTSCCNGCGS